MPIVEAGTPVEVRISDGAEGSVLVDGIALDQADIGQQVDVRLLPDAKYVVANVTISATASNVGEARVTGAGLAAFTTANLTYDAGVTNNGPLSFHGWEDTFWTWDRVLDKLSITTALIRESSFNYSLPTLPLQFHLRVADTPTFTIGWEIYLRTLNGSFPGDPDLQVSSVGTGQQDLVLATSGLLIPPHTPLLCRQVIRTKGGGLATYEAQRWHHTFDPIT